MRSLKLSIAAIAILSLSVGVTESAKAGGYGHGYSRCSGFDAGYGGGFGGGFQSDYGIGVGGYDGLGQIRGYQPVAPRGYGPVAPPVFEPQPVCIHYIVQYRETCHCPWRTYKWFDCLADARHFARRLQCQVHDVRIIVR